MGIIAKQLSCIRQALPKLSPRSAKRQCLEKRRAELKAVQQQIKASNAAFEAATPEQKRVMIAKEVITQIKLANIKPDHRGYLTFNRVSAELERESIQEVLLTQNDASCTVCGIGALAISCSLLNGKAKIRDRDGIGHGAGDTFRNGLHNYFSNDQLKLVEAVFEDRCSVEGFPGYDSPARRLTAIMKNIIKNNGTLKAPKLWGFWT
jgi:hypothetical protein